MAALPGKVPREKDPAQTSDVLTKQDPASPVPLDPMTPSGTVQPRHPRSLCQSIPGKNVVEDVHRGSSPPALLDSQFQELFLDDSDVIVIDTSSSSCKECDERISGLIGEQVGLTDDNATIYSKNMGPDVKGADTRDGVFEEFCNTNNNARTREVTGAKGKRTTAKKTTTAVLARPAEQQEVSPRQVSATTSASGSPSPQTTWFRGSTVSPSKEVSGGTSYSSPGSSKAQAYRSSSSSPSSSPIRKSRRFSSPSPNENAGRSYSSPRGKASVSQASRTSSPSPRKEASRSVSQSPRGKIEVRQAYKSCSSSPRGKAKLRRLSSPSSSFHSVLDNSRNMAFGNDCVTGQTEECKMEEDEPGALSVITKTRSTRSSSEGSLPSKAFVPKACTKRPETVMELRESPTWGPSLYELECPEIPMTSWSAARSLSSSQETDLEDKWLNYMFEEEEENEEEDDVSENEEPGCILM